MGLIFTKGDLKEVSEEVAKYKVRTFASCLLLYLFDFRLFLIFVGYRCDDL